MRTAAPMKFNHFNLPHQASVAVAPHYLPTTHDVLPRGPKAEPMTNQQMMERNERIKAAEIINSRVAMALKQLRQSSDDMALNTKNKKKIAIWMDPNTNLTDPNSATKSPSPHEGNSKNHGGLIREGSPFNNTPIISRKWVPNSNGIRLYVYCIHFIADIITVSIAMVCHYVNAQNGRYQESEECFAFVSQSDAIEYEFCAVIEIQIEISILVDSESFREIVCDYMFT